MKRKLKLPKVKMPRLRAAHAHVVTNGSVTFAAGVTLVLHGISPELEAISFFVTGVLACWAGDIERALRHPRLVGVA